MQVSSKDIFRNLKSMIAKLPDSLQSEELSSSAWKIKTPNMEDIRSIASRIDQLDTTAKAVDYVLFALNDWKHFDANYVSKHEARTLLREINNLAVVPESAWRIYYGRVNINLPISYDSFLLVELLSYVRLPAYIVGRTIKSLQVASSVEHSFTTLKESVYFEEIQELNNQLFSKLEKSNEPIDLYVGVQVEILSIASKVIFNFSKCPQALNEKGSYDVVLGDTEISKLMKRSPDWTADGVRADFTRKVTDKVTDMIRADHTDAISRLSKR